MHIPTVGNCVLPINNIPPELHVGNAPLCSIKFTVLYSFSCTTQSDMRCLHASSSPCCSGSFCPLVMTPNINPSTAPHPRQREAV